MIRRAPAAQFGLQNQTGSGRHRDAVPFPWATRLVSKSADLQSAGGMKGSHPFQSGSEAPVVHQFSNYHGSCPGQWPVKPPSLNRPEADEWCNATNSHHGRESEQQSCRFVEPDIAGVAPVAPANFKKQIPSGRVRRLKIRVLETRESEWNSHLPDQFRTLSSTGEGKIPSSSIVERPIVNRVIVVRIHAGEPFQDPGENRIRASFISLPAQVRLLPPEPFPSLAQ